MERIQDFSRKEALGFSQLDNSAISLKGEGLTNIKMCLEKKIFQKVNLIRRPLSIKC